MSHIFRRTIRRAGQRLRESLTDLCDAIHAEYSTTELLALPVNDTEGGMPTNDQSIVEDDAQEGIVDVDLAVILNEAKFPEFVHEKIDSGPRCADHLRQRLLRYFRQCFLRLARQAIA